jgi:hypothetical protein
MKTYFWIIFFWLLVGCGNQKIKPKAAAAQVTVLCQTHEPYCGGAYPGPGMENGHTFPMQNKTFLLKKGNSNDPQQPVLQNLLTTHSGQIQLSLMPGTYSLISPEKILPFNDFLATHQRGKSSEFFHDQDTSCFGQWYRSADFTFEVIANQSNEYIFTRYTNCFSGHNPCSHYMGPLPP